MIGAKDYAKRKTAARLRQADMSAAGRDIGALPPVENPRRRARCKSDLQAFLRTYFPSIFCDKWSQNHLQVIDRLKTAIQHGGQFAMAMPRGTGKTSMSCFAALWAILYGYRHYVVVVGATDGKATDIMTKIKMSIETNQTLIADFPEVCYPVSKLEGIVNRCKGQTHNGQRTYIDWHDDRLVMPSIKGSLCSGSVFESVSMTSANIRGKNHLTAANRMLRPDFCIIDDPQTPFSAASAEQCKKRKKVIESDIMGMSGPGKRMTAVMTCTVIAKGDLCDEFLDGDKHPEWNGVRMRMMDAMPDDMDLWDQYRVIWGQSQREHKGQIIDATEFYRAHREEMDAGAKPTWPERFEPNEISAVQSAMNILIKSPATFYAEYQNEPVCETDEAEQITADLIAMKLNNLDRGVVQVGTSSITMYIDIHDKLLFWAITAWTDGFTGSVIDYGVWPRQKTDTFTMDDARYTLESEYHGMGRSGRIYQGLTDLTALCLGREYARDDGAIMRISRCHIDANWGPETPVVYRFCRQSQFANILTPCHGRGITATQMPLSTRKKQNGEKPGLEWYISNNKSKRGVRFCAYDANFWKTFTAQRLKTAQGDPGCLAIFGDKPYQHEVFTGHLCAEYFTPTAGQGRRVDVWQLRPQRPDNHWWDCVVGTAVAASVDGITLDAIGKIAVKKEKKVIKLPAYIPQ
jgi:hypothetical protein